MKFLCFHRVAYLIFLSWACISIEPVAAQKNRVDFGRTIRPILAENCFTCHGPSKKDRKGKLRLDTKDGLFGKGKSGEITIVPDKSTQSELYLRLTTDDEDERMPKKESKKKLSPEQIAAIKKWIDQGARWEEHWSYVAPQRPALPKVSNPKWPRNTIDSFILARLGAESLKPSPEAGKETLIRRVTYDLIGLPPTLKEIDAFLADKSPNAYEKLVDRLLASPHFGEHKARYWLDAARYGDTHGLHLDNRRQIWPYRDWVIRAMNKNMPFDQFTIEQLAGDLLPNATVDQKIATGFNRCNVTSGEGGAIDEEYYVHYTNDRVATMSTVWMGATMGCVTCHDHKFDPFASKDFYQLFAFFNSLEGKIMDGNKPLPPPIIQVPDPALEEKLAGFSKKIAATQNKLKLKRNEASEPFVAWEKAQRSQGNTKPPLPTAGLIGHWTFDDADSKVRSSVGKIPPGKILGGASRIGGKFGKAFAVTGKKYLNLGKSDVFNFDRTQAFSYGVWAFIKPGKKGGAIVARMNDKNKHRGYDLYTIGDKVSAHFINAWPNNALRVITKNTYKKNQWQHFFVTYDGSGKLGGVKIYINGISSPLTAKINSLKGTTKANVPLTVGRRTPGAPFNGLVDDLRIYNRSLSGSEVAILAGGSEIHDILAIAPEKRTPIQRETLLTHYLANHDKEYQRFSADGLSD